MRVLHCIPSMQGGGAERQLTYLARALRDLGCDVHVALNGGGPNLAALRESGATIHHLGLRYNHDLRLVSRLLDVMRAVQPDIVQCWLTQMEIAGGLAAAISRIPWVFAERSSAEAYPRTFKNLLRARMASAAGAIVSNSAAGDCYWRHRAPRTVPRYVIPNGLPLEALAAVSPASSQETGLAPGQALVLFAGRFEEEKNAGAFVYALSQVRPSVSLRAMMCGEGPLRPDIERLITALGLEARVTVVDYMPQLWSLMKRASVLVSTSIFEGSPNVVLEAMAIGCPLVVSDIPTHRELLDERGAILVPPDDPEALARSIESVLADPEAAWKRAAVAGTRSSAHALNLIAREYLRVYDDVISRRRDPVRSPAI